MFARLQRNHFRIRSNRVRRVKPDVVLVATEILMRVDDRRKTARLGIIRYVYGRKWTRDGVGYIEIFNEEVYDLLDNRKQVTTNQNADKLTIKEGIVSDGHTIMNILTQSNQ